MRAWGVVAFGVLGGLTSSTVDGCRLQLSFAFRLDVRDCLAAAALMLGTAFVGAVLDSVVSSKSPLRRQLVPF